MREGLECLLVRFGHLGLYVVEEEGEGLAAELGHLVQLTLQGRDLETELQLKKIFGKIDEKVIKIVLKGRKAIQ